MISTSSLAGLGAQRIGARTMTRRTTIISSFIFQRIVAGREVPISRAKSLQSNRYRSTDNVSPSSSIFFSQGYVHSFQKSRKITDIFRSGPQPCVSKQKLCPIICIGCASFLHTSSNRFGSISGSNNGNKDKDDSDRGEMKKEKDTDSLLETWFYEVCQYGSLTANLPFSTIIKPLNPQDYPDMNKVIVQLHYDAFSSDSDADSVPPSHQLSQISGLYDLNVKFDEDRANMNLTCDVIKGLDLPVLCTLHVPLKFGLTVKLTGEKDVYIEKMESDSLVVETEFGDCKLHNMKCGSVSIVSQSGDIVCNSTLLGNTILYTGSSGGILMEKIQGSSVTCKTELGPMSVKSLYAETSTFKTVFGNIRLGHCHGQVHVLGENSQVNIDSLDGDLDVALQNGSVGVLLSRHNRVDIDVNTVASSYKGIIVHGLSLIEEFAVEFTLDPLGRERPKACLGNIRLNFPEGASTDLNLNCPKLTLQENVGAVFKETDLPHHREGYIGQAGVSQVNARTLSGSISLRLLDWIETTKLAFKREE